MPSTPLRRKLRADAHALKPVVQIGVKGLTETVFKQITAALAIHELIKIGVSGDAPEGRFAIAAELAARGVLLPQVIGNMIVAYAPAANRKKAAEDRAKSGVGKRRARRPRKGGERPESNRAAPRMPNRRGPSRDSRDLGESAPVRGEDSAASPVPPRGRSNRTFRDRKTGNPRLRSDSRSRGRPR